MTDQPPQTTLTPLDALRPAPWNPREIASEDFQNLCRSIEADPGFLWSRPVLAMADGTIYAGSQRYRAVEHLGQEAVPAQLEDVSEAVARARAILDNTHSGTWNAALLQESIDIAATLDRPLGFRADELAALLPAAHVEPEAPESFREFGEDIATDYCCPKCGYSWSGQPG
jgi:ParB-like chromosome segregation protein Spo0J